VSDDRPFASIDAVPRHALCVPQPWAWAICNAGLPLDNRDWPACHFRGPFLVHASKPRRDLTFFAKGIAAVADALGLSLDPLDARLARAAIPRLGTQNGHRLWDPGPEIAFGSIIGVASVAGVVHPDGAVLVGRRARALSEAERRAWSGGFALLLERARRLEPIECPSGLSFFRVPDPVRGALAVSR
jgi:hypothetical protein